MFCIAQRKPADTSRLLGIYAKDVQWVRKIGFSNNQMTCFKLEIEYFFTCFDSCDQLDYVEFHVVSKSQFLFGPHLGPERARMCFCLWASRAAGTVLSIVALSVNM